MREEKTKLVIEDNAIYEIDLECMRKKEERKRKKENKHSLNKKSSVKRQEKP